MHTRIQINTGLQITVSTWIEIVTNLKTTRVFYLEPQQSHFLFNTDIPAMVNFKRGKLKFKQ